MSTATTPEEFKSELMQMIAEAEIELGTKFILTKQTCSDCNQDPCICAHASLGDK